MKGYALKFRKNNFDAKNTNSFQNGKDTTITA